MELRSPSLPAQLKDVISYEEDVYAWVYFDQQDNLFRYEAYVVGYTDAGEQGTLELVIEEGVLTSHDYSGITSRLTSVEWERLHEYCAQYEADLKRKHRARWIGRLKALGYDVIGSI